MLIFNYLYLYLIKIAYPLGRGTSKLRPNYYSKYKMLNNISIFNTIFNDAPQPWQIGFQDSAAPGFTGIVELHNTIFFYLVVISVGVFWVLGSVIYYFNSTNSPIVHK